MSSAVKLLFFLVVISTCAYVQSHSQEEHQVEEYTKFTASFHAIFSTLVISLFPILVLAFVPLTRTINGVEKVDKKLLKTLLAFAVGGLLGDVFLHLLPHAQSSGHGHSHAHAPPSGHPVESPPHGEEGHVHENEQAESPGHGAEEAHDHSGEMYIGLCILLGMFVFFILEKIAVLNNGGGHGHSHEQKHKTDPIGDKIAKRTRSKSIQGDLSKEKDSDGLDDVAQERLKASAILNMISDFSHNVTDGLAIAASYLVSKQAGYGTTIAILFHEIPHEIGDLAILAQSGYTKKQVMGVQLLTGLGALVGTFIGLAVGEVTTVGWILPFTAGGFIYISVADVIPQLFVGTDTVQTVKECAAMVLGVAMMYFIALLE
eukprot:TRINITY_DN8699_c0_g1_i1.p1 TRINITY_DN8699_c0_g1~~TRINITY_DN8699_c0_g1_i1.p1  ORF type:complete len:400 (+),score=85.52 TRINITY_DN8699_c0_g1_i1:79-1200(+)